eukprot:6206403-Pleurochrysis_carterae.AAC.1
MRGRAAVRPCGSAGAWAPRRTDTSASGRMGAWGKGRKWKLGNMRARQRLHLPDSRQCARSRTWRDPARWRTGDELKPSFGT